MLSVLFDAFQLLDDLEHAPHGDDGHALHLQGALFHVAVGHDGAGKAQAGGLADALLQIGHSAALTRQTQLADDDEIVGDDAVGQRRNQSGGNGQIGKTAVNPEALA